MSRMLVDFVFGGCIGAVSFYAASSLVGMERPNLTLGICLVMVVFFNTVIVMTRL